jgi:hypothetical protein
MADQVTDPTVTGDGTDSFDISQIITNGISSAAQVYAASQQQQAALQKQQISLQSQALNSSTYITLAVLLAAVILLPKLL